MIHTLHRLSEFLKYQKRAKTKYYLHSPFVYQFYLQVLEGGTTTETAKIKTLRRKLLQTYDKIRIDDMGATPGSRELLVSSIAQTASMPERYGKVLFRLTKMQKPVTILEMGTCLGIGTSYMALAAPDAKVITMEGCDDLVRTAKKNFEELAIHNTSIVKGNFDDTLTGVLADISTLDLVFIDGNHRYEPTMRYFHQLMTKTHAGSVLIFDDIYWSEEMTLAWEEIKKDNRISLTIDIYRLGIAFLQSDKLAKEDFVLRY